MRDHDVSSAPLVSAPAARHAVFAGAAITLLAGSIELAGALRGRSLFLTADAVHLMAHMGIYVSLVIPGEAWGRRRDWGSIVVLLLVLLIAIGIVVASARDLFAGAETVEPLAMLLSLVGLAANLLTAWLFRRAARQTLSFRAAFVHELSDGSMTVVGLIGAGLIAWRHWSFIDPLLSLGIGAGLVGWTAPRLTRLLGRRARPS
jgi:Co/Zn/Cd efflux system component